MPTTREANALRLLVAEDHPLFRDALVGVIATAFPNAEVFQATSIDSALDILASKGSVDMILLDLSMPGTTGLLGAFRVRVAAPKSALVIVSAYESARIVRCAMSLGIAGYIPKSTPKAELVQSIRSILEGEVSVPKRFQGTTATRRAGAEIQDLLRELSRLTVQQLRVLVMI
jgi:DNA-binding NarL/FixJ family response regulator